MANVEQDKAAGMRVITISREYGSGGGEIAAQLAGRLGWRLVDHEVVVQVARALGVSEEDAAAYDERAESLVSRAIAGLSVLQPIAGGRAPDPLMMDSRDYETARRQVVERALAEGRAVIVGRGAQVLLRDRRDVLHARVVAPLEGRITYVMRREGLDRAAAEARIHLKDRGRTHFLLSVHHQNPADALLYDLVVNTGVLDLDGVVDLLLLALERKATRLAVSPAALGPGADQARYPAPPSNFAAPAGGPD